MAKLKLTDQLCDEICNDIKAGVPIKHASISHGITERTFYNWFEKGKEAKSGKFRQFYDKIQEAKSVAITLRARRIYKAGEDNWQTESATNQLLISRDTGKIIGPEDIVPEWADEKLLQDMVNPGVGPTVRFKRKHTMWGDKLREIWNNVKSERGPLQYFQGALIPVLKQNGNVYYKYKGLPKRNPKKTKHWKT